MLPSGGMLRIRVKKRLRRASPTAAAHHAAANGGGMTPRTGVPVTVTVTGGFFSVQPNLWQRRSRRLINRKITMWGLHGG